MCIGISLYTTLSNTCTGENIGFCVLITSKLQLLKKTDDENVQSVLQHYCKMSWKAMLLVWPLTSNLFCNKSACCNLIEYCPLIGWDYPWVAPYMVVKSLVAKQVSVGPVKCATFTDFVTKRTNLSLLFATTFRSLHQPDLLQDRFDSLLVKRATSFFNLSCSIL